LGRYELLRRLAVGGMGELYLARLRGAANFEKRFVIKKILPNLAQQPEFVARFVDEAHILVRLTHGNIVSVFDMGEADGELYMAMEYIQGCDLRLILRRRAARGERLAPALCVFIAAEVCKGLSYAHQKADDQGRPMRIVHRDISPSNILVSRDGEVKLVDFGIARATEAAADASAVLLQGKLAYMSPEQASGLPTDARADLFSLGVVLYELLTGARPFEGRSDLDLIARVKAAAFAPASTLRPDLDPQLDALLARLLARDPADRPPSADALLSDLMGLLMAWGQLITASALSAALSDDLRDEPSAPLTLDRALDLEAERLLATDTTRTRTRTQSVPAHAPVVAWAEVHPPTTNPTPPAPPAALTPSTPPAPVEALPAEDTSPPPAKPTQGAASPPVRRRGRASRVAFAALIWVAASSVTAWWLSRSPTSPPADASTVASAPQARPSPDARSDIPDTPDALSAPPTRAPDMTSAEAPDTTPDPTPAPAPRAAVAVTFAPSPPEALVQVKEVGGAALTPDATSPLRFDLTPTRSYTATIRADGDWLPCALLILASAAGPPLIEPLDASAPCAAEVTVDADGGATLAARLNPKPAPPDDPKPSDNPKTPPIKVKRPDAPPTRFVIQTDRRASASVDGGKPSAPDTRHVIDLASDKAAADVLLRPPAEGSFTYLGERLRLSPTSPPRACAREGDHFACDVSFADHATLMVNTFLGAEKINCDITINGQTVAARFNHAKVRVRPGRHTVRAQRCERGQDAEATVSVTAGQSLGVPFDLSPR
jgi:serine/threonine-protein kinase